MIKKLRFTYKWGEWGSKVAIKLPEYKAGYQSALCPRGVEKLFTLKGKGDIILHFTDIRPDGSDYYELSYDCLYGRAYYKISDKLLLTMELDEFSEWESELDDWVHQQFGHSKPIYLSLLQF